MASRKRKPDEADALCHGTKTRRTEPSGMEIDIPELYVKRRIRNLGSLDSSVKRQAAILDARNLDPPEKKRVCLGITKATLGTLGVSMVTEYKCGLQSVPVTSVDKNHPVVAILNRHLLENRGFKLSGEQLRVAFQLLHKGQPGLVVAWEMGLGKTVVGALVAALLLFEGVVSRVVAIVPKSLKANLESTLEACGFDEVVSTFGPAGCTTAHYFKIMTSPEAMGQFTPLLSCDKETRVACYKTAREIFMGSLLIVDESHNYRTAFSMTEYSSTGHRTVLMILLAEMATKRLLLTGTPVKNDPYDLVPQAAMARGSVDILRKDDLSYILDVMPDGCTNAMGLHSSDHRQKHLKSQFSGLITFLGRGEMPCFPSIERKEIDIRLDEKQTKKYNDIITKLQGGGHIDPKTVASRPATVKFKRSVFYHHERMASNVADNQKAITVVGMIQEILDKYPGRPKSLIYSNFKASGVGLFGQLLLQAGIRYGLITGNSTPEERLEEVRRINAGEIDSILLTKAGGEGLDLIGIEHVFILEPAWNESTERQAESRAVRRNSHAGLPKERQKVTVYKLRVCDAKGNPTGDEVVDRVKDGKKPCIESFIARLKGMCDPLG